MLNSLLLPGASTSTHAAMHDQWAQIQMLPYIKPEVAIEAPLNRRRTGRWTHAEVFLAGQCTCRQPAVNRIAFG